MLQFLIYNLSVLFCKLNIIKLKCLHLLVWFVARRNVVRVAGFYVAPDDNINSGVCVCVCVCVCVILCGNIW